VDDTVPWRIRPHGFTIRAHHRDDLFEDFLLNVVVNGHKSERPGKSMSGSLCDKKFNNWVHPVKILHTMPGKHKQKYIPNL
jgi:hypothetical protein